MLTTYVMPVTVEGAGAARDDVSLLEADAELLAALRERFPRDVDERKHGILIARLASPVERCWVIVDSDGVPCGYCHAAVASVLNARINAMVRLEPGQAYLFDSFVVRERRGRGLHGFSVARRMELLAEEGIDEVVTIISRGNTRSLAAFLPYGPRAVERLLYLPPVNTTLRMPVRAARR